MLEILKNIINNKYNKLTHHKLDKNYIIDKDHDNIITLLKNLNMNDSTRFFVSKTLVVDSINVVDIDGTKMIEFENDLYEFTNKGLNNSYELFLN